MTALPIDVQLSSHTPAPDPGFINAKLRISATDPIFASFEVPVGGTSGSTALAVVVEIALTPGSPGNFTVAHGLPAAPAFVLIQMDSGGDIWFQTPLRYDATNLYLTASDGGIVGKAQCWLLAASAEIPFTSSIGNFSVPHGLGVAPVLIQIQKTAAGGVWLQTPNADATNVYLTGSDAGITGFLEVWKILPIPVSSNYARVALAPGAPGNFSVAHGLGAIPFLAEINMTSGGEIWFQSVRYDGTNLNLVASDAGITGYADVWAAAPSSAVISIPVTPAQGGTGAITLTAHAVLLGEGTSAVGFASPGTAGNVLTSNGASADPTFQAPGAAGVSSFNTRTGAVVPTTGDYTVAQVTGAASQVGVQDESYSYAADTGAANAYAIAPSPTVTSYVAGQSFSFKAANSNTGASTLNVSGLGTKSIKKLNGSTALASGDIVAGQIVTVSYDGTNFQMQSPAATAGGGGGGAPTTSEYILGAVDATLTNAAAIPGLYSSIDVLPASAGTIDDEFPGSSLSGSWTSINAPTAVVAGSYLNLSCPGSASTKWEYIYQTAPSTPWGVQMPFSILSALAANFWSAGLVLSDSSGKIIHFGFTVNNGLVVQYYNSPTSFNSAPVAAMAGLNGKTYIRLKDDGTNITFWYSIQGVAWYQFGQLSRTAFLTSGPTRVGIGVDSENSNIVYLETDWFRRYV